MALTCLTSFQAFQPGPKDLALNGAGKASKRFAILTDVHVNKEAFGAVMPDVTARAFDRLVILGDVVGYGPDPGWCADRVELLLEKGALVLRGTHDDALLRPDPAMSPSAAAAINWT